MHSIWDRKGWDWHSEQKYLVRLAIEANNHETGTVTAKRELCTEKKMYKLFLEDSAKLIELILFFSSQGSRYKISISLYNQIYHCLLYFQKPLYWSNFSLLSNKKPQKTFQARNRNWKCIVEKFNPQTYLQYICLKGVSREN